jgi:PAS domain S-box-containing protein
MHTSPRRDDPAHDPRSASRRSPRAVGAMPFTGAPDLAGAGAASRAAAGPPPPRSSPYSRHGLGVDREAERHGIFEQTVVSLGSISCRERLDAHDGSPVDIALIIDDDEGRALDTCRAARRTLAHEPLIGLLCPQVTAPLDGACDLVIRTPSNAGIARVALRAMMKLRTALLAFSEREPAVVDEDRQDYFTRSPDLCCTFDRGGRFIDANDAFATAADIDLGTLIGLSGLDLFHPEDHGRITEAFARMRDGGTLTHIEYRMRLGDGSWHWVSWTTAPSPDRTAFYATGRDVTRRHDDERRAAQTAEDLARVNSELERFAYAASHDLKEPLRMISSYLHLLRQRHERDIGSDGNEFIGYCLDAADRLRVTLDTLLTYATSGTSQWSPILVRLRNPLVHALQNLEPATSAAGAVVTVDGELPIVRGNPVLLTLLFQNLIQNALKYRSQARPEIAISSAHHDGEQCTVSVADNGIGIGAADLERIFDAFQRGAPGGTVLGSGIGLATCRRIVERHGGRIWAESTPGAGTVMRFTLPAVA